MKTTVLASLLAMIFSSQSYAQNLAVASNRQDALKSCQEKASASPKDLRQKMLSSCECVVNKTDFDKANQLHKAGETQALKSLYETAAKSCQ